MRAARVRLAAGVLVAGLLALFAGLAPGTPKGSGVSAGSGRAQVAIGRAVLVCSGIVAGSGVTSTISAGAWPAKLPSSVAKQLAGSPPAVTTTLLRSSGGQARVLSDAEFTDRGTAAQATLPAGTDRAVAVVATGKLAPGATASVSSRASTGAQRGLAEAACIEPGTQFWLTGLSESLGEHATVQLANVDDSPAQLEVTLYDGRGKVAGPGTGSVRVPAHGRITLDLDKLAPGSTALAAEVHAVSGRVVAAAHQTGVSGETSLGNGWLPAGTDAARTVVLPGVAADAAKVTLTLLAPGDDAGTATIRLLTADGPIEPAGRNQVSLEPGHIATVDLTGTFAEEAAAVQIKADVPVVAGLRQQAKPAAGGTHDTDIALTGPAAALRQPVAMAGQPPGATGEVLLTATGRAASATVAVLNDHGGTVTSSTVKVPVGSTVSSALPGSAAGHTVLVTPASGGKLMVSRVATATVDGVPQLSVLQPAPPQVQATRAQLSRSLR